LLFKLIKQELQTRIIVKHECDSIINSNH
jgi:hypothetical protein